MLAIFNALLFILGTAFILGFVAYGLGSAFKSVENQPPPTKIPEELRQRLKEDGFINKDGQLEKDALVKAVQSVKQLEKERFVKDGKLEEEALMKAIAQSNPKSLASVS
ncbi:MAG: hypothetical protein ACRC2S_15325 [Waterburya sp.]